MNKDILKETKKRKLSINSKEVIIGLVSLMGVIMTTVFLTLIL